MTYYFIILSPDNNMQTCSLHPVKSHYQKGSRFFQAKEDTTIADISYWYAIGNPAKDRDSNPTIVEIEGKV